MPVPDDHIADELERKADEFDREGDKLKAQAQGFRQAAAALRGLTVNRRSGRVKPVTSEQRLHLSGMIVGSGKNAPDWLRAARKAGLPSLGAIAEFLGKSVSFMSQVKSGKKRMPEDLAARFETKTGYPASRWPRR